MAITGRSVPNHPIVVTALGVQVVGTQAIVASQQPTRRRFVYNQGANTVGSGEFKQSPQVNVALSTRPDRRYLRVNTPYITRGSEAPTGVASPYTVSVTASPVPAVWRRVVVPTVTGAPTDASPYAVNVATSPVPASWRRVNTPLVASGLGADPTVVTPVVIAAARTPKVRAPRPIVIYPIEIPATPGSPGPTVIVRPRPNPRPTTQPPLVLTSAAGASTPPAPPTNVAWCAQTPVTGWASRDPFTGWEADTPQTNWLAVTPEEDC